jgi:prevent-host-death family protein
MEISVTQFRRDIFNLVQQAIDGKEVWITHKGRRVKVVPEIEPGSRLNRITPLALINSAGGSLKQKDRSLLEEMARAWERDWSTL